MTSVAAGAAASHFSVKVWWPLVKQAGSAWVADYAPSMGAALSYYSVFSLAPLLLIVISLAGLVFGQDAVRGELFGQLSGLLGSDAAQAIEGLLVSVSKPAEGIASTLIGLVLLFIGATTVFGELQDALDRIWQAPVRDRSGGLWGLLRARLLSFSMISLHRQERRGLGFGAAGSLIVVFIWVYYSAQIFLIGAEFTWVYATTFGSMRQLTATAEEKTTGKLPNAIVASAAESALQPTPQPSAAQARTETLEKALPALRIGVALVAGMGAGLILPRLRRLWLNRREPWSG